MRVWALRPFTTNSDSLPEQTPDLTTLRATTVCQRELVSSYYEVGGLCLESPPSAGLGNPVPAPIEPEVVGFVIRQLQGGLLGTCLRSILKVSGFRSQVNLVSSESSPGDGPGGAGWRNGLLIRVELEARKPRGLRQRDWAERGLLGQSPQNPQGRTGGPVGGHNLHQR